MSEPTQSAEIDAAFDRWSVPSFVRPGLLSLLANAWQEGYEAHENDADDWENGSVPEVRHRRATTNPYLIETAEEFMERAGFTRVLPPEVDQS